MSVTDFGDDLHWRKSRRSDPNGGACVYVAGDHAGRVGVRDSKRGTAGAPQWHPRADWVAFVAGIKAGEFDRHA